MKRLLATLLIILCTALASLTANPVPAHATGNAIAYALTCSSLTVYGETNSPYLGFSAVLLPLGVYMQVIGAGSGTALGTVGFPEVPTGTTIVIEVFGAVDAAGTWDTQPFDSIPATCPSSYGTLPLRLFNDGRINYMDADQSAAVYCNVPSAGDVRVYAIHDSKGYLAFTATKAEIDAVPDTPAQHTLIKEAVGAQLWRLTNGNLEVRRNNIAPGSVYSFQWPEC